MEWPITPTFFRKVGVYQRLVDAQNGFKQKDIWDAEKVALKWAAGPGHQLIGSPINHSHVKDFLGQEIVRTGPGDVLGLSLFRFALAFPNNLLEALVMHGFAEVPLGSAGPDYQVRFTPDGFMAGKILIETNDLQNAKPYKFAVNSWWAIIFLGSVILLREAFPGLFPWLSTRIAHFAIWAPPHSR
jgi:hypothetical protein